MIEIILAVILLLVVNLMLWAGYKMEAYAKERRSNLPKFYVFKDGVPVDPTSLANEDWIRNELTVTSRDDLWFAVDDQGSLYVLDSCGNYTHCPSEYRVLFWL